MDNNKDDDGDDTFLVEEAPDVSHDVLHVSIKCEVSSLRLLVIQTRQAYFDEKRGATCTYFLILLDEL